jgi:hypothetical protein
MQGMSADNERRIRGGCSGPIPTDVSGPDNFSAGSGLTRSRPGEVENIALSHRSARIARYKGVEAKEMKFSVQDSRVAAWEFRILAWSTAMEVLERQVEGSDLDLEGRTEEADYEEIASENVADFFLSIAGLLFLSVIVAVTAIVALAMAVLRHS